MTMTSHIRSTDSIQSLIDLPHLYVDDMYRELKIIHEKKKKREKEANNPGPGSASTSTSPSIDNLVDFRLFYCLRSIRSNQFRMIADGRVGTDSIGRRG